MISDIMASGSTNQQIDAEVRICCIIQVNIGGFYLIARCRLERNNGQSNVEELKVYVLCKKYRCSMQDDLHCPLVYSIKLGLIIVNDFYRYVPGKVFRKVGTIISLKC